MYRFEIIENYLSKNKCKEIADYMIANQSDHGLPNFKNFNMTLNPKDDAYYDPDNLISTLAEKAKLWFLKNYDVKELEFNRCHGTLMYPGSYLWPHIDEESPYNDGNSYVCLLFLSDYEGGNLIFPDQDLSLHFKMGDVIFFPGFLMKHGVSDVINGIRINLITHFFGEKSNAIV